MAAAPAMASLWDTVLELTKMAQDRGTDPLLYSFQISSTLNAAGVSIPSPDFAAVLVSHICWSNNVPIAWKFLEKALTVRVVPPLSVLALLSTRVIPNRKIYPVAYRLYMELMKRYIFTLKSLINCPNYPQIMESVNQTLNLPQTFGLPDFETGLVFVEFIFKTVWELVDASLDDEGLLELSAGKESMWPIRTQDMEIDNRDALDGKRVEQNELFLKMNTILATEIVGEFFQNKVTSKILFLARRNMPSYWEPFIQNLQLLASNSTAIRNSKSISPEALLQLTCDTDVFLTRDGKTSTLHRLHAVVDSSLASFASRCHGTSPSAYWLPIDLFLEDSLDGSQVIATSAAETLTVLVKALQAVNCTTWEDTFLGLWVAALRLVQRERHLSEGPVPRLDTCLCMVLSITPLAIANIIDEEECELNLANQGKSSSGQRRQALISSLKQLDDYEGLLTPPLQVVSVANQAAAKAMMFLSGLSVSSGYFDGISLNDMPLNCAGNLRHLVVEACIARNVLDTSAYFWPGYVKGRCNQIPCGISGQVPGWSSLMKGSPLTPQMMSVLVSTPASSLAELEKIYEFAVNGSDEEKISASTVLCGASLTRGWNIQEHIVMFITRLLSPPVPKDHTGCESHLISCAPFLNVLLVGISSIDCIETLSLHGLVPQLAGALMPICEVFGSCAPTVTWAVTREELSSHAVFSNAFTLLLKLWRFDEPPFETANGELCPSGSRVTPEYLLLVRNRQLAATENSSNNQFKRKRFSRLLEPWPSEPVFMDSFPKLKSWYRQNLACLCSTLSGLVHGTPVHQLVEALLSFMFRRLSRDAGQQPLTPPTTSGSSNSSGPPGEDLSDRLKVPAWDILEAVPFALDAALTACAHGRLSPRELTTGLKDLADFLPASLATIISYFSAEVTRGLWKPASMNGTDWPSPAANLASVEQQIKKTLAATGVHVPSLPVDGSSVSTLPLPLAVLLSLTITYKLDRDTGRFLNFVGCSLNNLATVCPWPCMPIIVSLWAQKIKRWSDFLVFSASRTVFHHNRDAVVQLLRVCFKATLGLNNSITSTSGGVGALLGHGFVSHFSGSISPSAPGIMYLRVHRSVRNALFLTEEIVSLLMSTVGDVANPPENLEKLKKTKHGLRYGQVSLVSALARLKLAASLGASLIWITGGLSLVQSLINETLPSWFISVQKPEPLAAGVEMMRGHALAYFTVLCMAFALGVGPLGPRRAHVVGRHMEFLASALEGKISLGCNEATWRAYLSGFVSMMVVSTPKWVREVDVRVVKRLSKGLKEWKEEDLGVALLGVSGVAGMGEAAEMIILRRV